MTVIFTEALAKSDLIERDGLVAIEYPREIGRILEDLALPDKSTSD